MWSRVLGLSNEKREIPSSSSGRRNDDDKKRSERKQTTSTQKGSKTEEKDRGIDPTPTNNSSSSRAQYSGAIPTSVASSYVTAQSNNTDETILPPQPVKNASSASEMPKSQSGRGEQSRDDDREREKGRKKDRSTSRDRKADRQTRSRSRDREERRRDRKERRERRIERDGGKDRGSRKSESDYQGTSRAGEAISGGGSFSAQIGGSGFTQFPGQLDGGMPGFPSGPPHPTHMSDHVPDQFPGQFPISSSAPYRPPLTVEQGGPGLAADYYGDAGESVATQPGVRPQAPTLIVGAQPHLMAASPVEAPPPEPSSTGGVGAAASFFSGATFESPPGTPKLNQPPGRPTGVPLGAPLQPPYSNQPGSFGIPAALAGTAALGYIATTHGETPHGSTQGPPSNSAGLFQPQNSTRPPPNVYPTASIPPVSHYTSASAPIIPALGSAAIGAAAGYMMEGHTSQQQSTKPSMPIQGPADYRPSSEQRPSQQIDTIQGSYTGYDRPQQPGKQSPSSSNLPLYAAGALGAAGLAAAAYHHEHHNSHPNSYSGQSKPPAFMPQQHRHSGPLSKLVDFFRDPEGVAQFEEYTEYIGVCRYCFAPGSSPREAPRKHYYRRKRSNERLGASIRVDKESRYSSSDGENRRKNKNSSWIASGIAGIGLAKVGDSLFASNHDFDDTYSVRSGHPKQSTASFNDRRYDTSLNQKSSISHGVITDPSNVHSAYDKKRRSMNKDHETGIGEAALVAAMGAASIAESSSKTRSRSPRRAFDGSKPRSRERDYEYGSERRRKDHAGHAPQSAYIEVTGRTDYKEKGRDSKKKKKKAGFFSFANSSSSDTGLVAHTGSDRSRTKRSSRTKIKDHNDANAALLGLGAAAAALAAADGRKSDKGKRRADVIAVKQLKAKDDRRSDERRVDSQKSTHSNMDEAQWESVAEEGGYSSVDSALAYGVSRRRSHDSLRSDSSGTDKWGWRWGSSSRKGKDKPKEESRLTETIIGSAVGLAGAAAGASIYTNEDSRHAARSSNSSLPPLQHVYPVATSDPSHYDFVGHDSIMSSNQPIRTSRPAAIPLQQPQPVMPVSSVIYTSQAPYNHTYSAPAGPPVFSQPPQSSSFVPGYGNQNDGSDLRQGFVVPRYPLEQAISATVPLSVNGERKPRRRKSSPAPEIIHIEPRQTKRSSTRDDMSAVRFELTEEQINKELRDREREREQKKSDILAREGELQHADDNQRKSKRGSRSGDNPRRDEEIDMELDRLRKQEDTSIRQTNGNAWVAPALVGLAGAVIGAAAAGYVPGREDRRDIRRDGKSDEYDDRAFVETNKKNQISEIEDEGQISHDERQKALAKKAAALVKRTPSPTHQDYSSFFAPVEILSKSKGKAIADDSNGGNDITTYSVPQIVTTDPSDQRGPPSSIPYTFLGADEEGRSDPNLMSLPWQVPRLNLIKPTPPASMAGSVRGDASPILRPEDVHVSDDEEHEQTEKNSKRVKVTFGDSETREFEVVTPEDHRDEFIKDTSEYGPIEKGKAQEEAIPSALSQGTKSPVEEVTRDRMPGEFGDDLDFAATLAAGLQGSGFDPAIVIDDPTYRRRDSPPGSESREFYRRPFYETVEDLSLDSPGTEGAPPQRGFVEDEIPPTPKDELVRPVEHGNDKSKELTIEDKAVEKSNDIAKISQNKDEFRGPHNDSEVPEIIEVAPRSIFHDHSASPIDQRPHANEPTSNVTIDKDEFQDASEFVSIDDRIRELPDGQPEADDALEADLITTKNSNKKSKGRGIAQEQEINAALGNGLISNAATAQFPDQFEEPRKSKKRSKRKTSKFDDAPSAVSSPPSFDTEKDVNDRWEDGTPALVSGVMDLTDRSSDQGIGKSPQKTGEATVGDFEGSKKKGKKSKGSKYKADEEWFNIATPDSTPDSSKAEGDEGDQIQRSSSKKDKQKKNRRKNGFEDSGMVTQGIPAENGNLENEKNTSILPYLDDHDPDRGIPRSNELDQPLSFLGMRREVTEPPDISNTQDTGSTIRRISSEETFRDAIRSKIIEQGLPPLPASRPTSPTAVGSTGDLPSLPPSRTASPVATPGGQRRRFSMLQLAESNHAGSSPSPTAVPLMFRRFPSSNGISRSTPSSPAPSPRAVAPFSPRQRQGRPLSTEFKSSTEFRPLWLVERHNPSRRGQGAEVAEEIYPSLPSSHSTSRASSVHDPDVHDPYDTLGDEAFDRNSISPQGSRFGYAHDSDRRDDFLDSQQPTPTRDSFFAERETGPDSNLLENEEKYPEISPPIPRSKDSSPYTDTLSRDGFSTAEGVVIGAAAAGALATALNSTSRSDRDYDLNENRSGKRESEESSHMPEVERSKSESGAVDPSDYVEAYSSNKDRKKENKKQRKADTFASAEIRVANDMPPFGDSSLDRGMQDGNDEDDFVNETTTMQTGTDDKWSSSTPDSSATSRKGKKQKGKVTFQSLEEQPPAGPSNIQEREGYDSGTRDSEKTKQEDLIDSPSSNRSKKAKKTQKSRLPQELEQNSRDEAGQSHDTVVPEDANLPSTFADIPEHFNEEMKPESGTLYNQHNTAEPMQVPILSPEAIALPTDDDLDLLPTLPPDSPLLEPMHIEVLSPEAIALPTDDDLDLLPALPSDSPLLEPRTSSEFVAEERDLPKEPTLMEVDHSRTTSRGRLAAVGETGLLRDVMESPACGVAKPPEGETRSSVQAFETSERFAETPYEPSSSGDEAVGTGRPSKMRDLVPESSSLKQQVDLELDHPVSVVLNALQAQGSQNLVPKLESSNNYSADKMDTIHRHTPIAKVITDPLLNATGKAPTLYEEHSTSMDYTPTQDNDIVDGYLENFGEDDKEVSLPFLKKNKKGKKGRKSQSVIPLDEPLLAERGIVDLSDQTSTSVPEIISGPSSKEVYSVVDEPATDEWATLSKKKGKKGRKSQPITPLEELPSTDRSIPEQPDEASTSVGDVVSEITSQTAFAVIDEPAVDEWATSSKKKGKKGKKKIVSYEDGDYSHDNQKDVMDISDVQDFGNVEQRSMETVPESIMTPKAIEDQKILMERGGSFSTTAADFTTARTDTAKEVSDMLGSLNKESATEDDASDIPRVSRALPEIEIQKSSGAIDEEDDWGGYAKKKGRKSKKTKTAVAASSVNAEPVGDEERTNEYSTATTDTAAEVRDMLIKTDDVDSVTPTQENNQFRDDDDFMGFTTNSNDKKDNKSTPPRVEEFMLLENIAATAVPSFDDASRESVTKEADSVDAFSMPKPKKDKKSKRKATSRSVSDYQDAPESSGKVAEDVADPQPIPTIQVAEPDQDLRLNEAASVALPAQDVDEFVKDHMPEREPRSLPLQAPIHSIDTMFVDDASKIALPIEEMDELEEQEEVSEEKAHATDDSADYEYSKSELESSSQLPLNESRIIDPLKEAMNLPLPEDIQDDFIDSNELARETNPSIDKFPMNATKTGNAGRGLTMTTDTTHFLDRSIDKSNFIPDIQEPATLYVEKDIRSVGQNKYNTDSLIPESIGREQRLENVRSVLENPPAELEYPSAISMKTPQIIADKDFKSFEYKTQMRPMPESFANQSEELATSSREIVDASPALEEQSNPVIDDDNFLGLQKTTNGKKLNKPSTSNWGEKPIAQDIEEPPAQALIQSESTSRDFVDPSPREAEPLTSIEDEGYSVSKKGKKGKKTKKSSTKESTREPSPMPELDQELSSIPTFDSVEVAEAEPQTVRPPTSRKLSVATDNNDVFDVPKGKKGKKKSKKSQARGWSDEPADTAASTDPDTAIPTVDTLASPADLVEPPLLAADEQPAMPTNNDDPLEPPKGKKGKRKSNKSQALDRANEANDVADTSGVDHKDDIDQEDVPYPMETERTVTQSLTEEPDSEIFSLKKSKKDKKQAKKGSRFTWDEEPVQLSKGLEDETEAGELSESMSKEDAVEAKPQESYEEETSEILGSSEKEMISSETLSKADVAGSTLLFGDKNNDQEFYPALGFEEGVVQEPDDIRALRTVEEPENSLEREAVPEPRDVDAPEPVRMRGTFHEPGDFEESPYTSRIESVPPQEAFHEAVPDFETRNTFESKNVHMPDVALEPALARKIEPPVRTSSFEQRPEMVPEPEHNQGIEPERQQFADTVDPQEDEISLPFGTKSKTKKGERSGQATPLTLQTREESLPLVDEEPSLTLQDIGLGTGTEGLHQRESLEKGIDESIFGESEYTPAALLPASVPSEPHRSAGMLEADSNDLSIAEDESPGFITKKKNKNGKNYQQTAHSGFQVPPTRTTNLVEDGAVEPVSAEHNRDVVKESSTYWPERTADSFETTTPDIPIAEDDIAGFAIKKKVKKGKKSKQSEDPVYEVPDNGAKTQELLLAERDEGLVPEPAGYGEERAEDIPKPNTRDKFIQDDDFVGFATKKRGKKGKISRQTEDSVFGEPVSESATTRSILLGGDDDIAESSSASGLERATELLMSNTKDDSVQDDDFVGFATKKKKGKKSRQSANQIFQEPDQETATMGTQRLEADREIAEGHSTYEQERVTNMLDSRTQDEPAAKDDFAGFATKTKGKKSKKSSQPRDTTFEETPTFLEKLRAPITATEVAPHQGTNSKFVETTDAAAPHGEQDTHQSTFFGEDSQRAAVPAGISDYVEPTDVSSREFRTEESDAPTMEEKSMYQEVIEGDGLKAAPTFEISQPLANPNTEVALQKHVQSVRINDDPPIDHSSSIDQQEAFATFGASGEEQIDSSLEIPTRKKSKKTKKGRENTSFTNESFPTIRSPASPYRSTENVEEAPILLTKTSAPDPLVEENSVQQDQLDRENGHDRKGSAFAIEDPSAGYTQGYHRELGIQEDLSRGETGEVREEAAALEPNAEEVWGEPTTKKGKKSKKSRKQVFDLEQTAPAANLQHGQTTADREPNITDDANLTSRNDFSMTDVPVVHSQGQRELEVEQEYSESRGGERNMVPPESRSTVKPLVAATAVGAGIALFEDLARRESISASTKDMKSKRKNDLESDLEVVRQGEPALEQSSGLPNAEEYHEASDKSYLGQGQTRALSPQYDASRNRDSAIHVADSPVPGAKSPLHYCLRDSGYQGNDASPTLQEVLALPRQNRISTQSSPRAVEHDYSPVQDYEKSTIDHDYQDTTRLREISHNPLNISIEVDPDYDVSISRPVQEQEVRREPFSGGSRELEVELPSSSYSEQNEHYQNANSASPIRHHDNRQPSPVDSTTRDRSSVLFQSSPSTREDNILTRPRGLSTEYPTEHTRDLEISQHGDEILTPVKTTKHTELSMASELESRKAPTSSLFGGPVGVHSDAHAIISPPGTPGSSSRRQLDTINEHGLDDSPLQKKAQRISDGGMQEQSLKGTRRSVTPQRHSQQRVRSPLGAYSESKPAVSTDDIISRLPWPAVDEDHHFVDPEGNQSRNAESGHRPTSRHSPLPALATDMVKQRELERRSISGASIRSGESISAYIRSPDVQSPATPPLRRVDRSVSGDLRAANKRGGANALAKEVEPALDTEPGFASSSTYDPATDKGKERITKMTDVYEGWGDVHDSPRSPTRPPSMRKRQSMQLLDLETRIDQLVSENRLLQDAKARADRQLGDAVQDHSQQKSAFDDAIRTRDLYVQQKNSELNELRGILEGLQNEVSHLTEINQGLSGSTRELTSDHEQRYGQLEDDHADVHQKWQESTRELEELRSQHASLSAGMEGIVRHEVDLALESKDVELRQMRNELESAKDQVRRLQQQILASRSSDDIIVVRDEDYFDSQCQQLCQHVQQWVLRFSKFSDMKPCRSINDVADEKISDRFDNAILDGSDVDIYLADRIRRRDVFMSVVMTMVWEYIFTRYLFGMDREQRQKLKSLEKTLSEVGPARAVNKWRATTLTMLSRRDAFIAQRQQDTEAVVREIYDTLAVLLPPPGHLVAQITDSLRKVMSSAVDLAVEMRCQRAEYIMLPPLQPEYDTHGDLARQVFFNAALMNERSGDTASNDELVAQQAVVRMVLFPLVVKKGDDHGVGDEEIVVCPAQVLVARETEPRAGKKTVRVVSAQSERAEGMSVAGQSVQSFTPSSMDAGMGGRF
ncbi:hypothetical protein MMC11_002441 [Xylographa trunciseda]|nr:hypothetical protein [Xylographa trunciseda]